MARIILFIAFVSFAASICFAQQAPIPVVKHQALVKMQNKTVTGKIESFTPADSAKGTKTELVLVDANENKVTFVLTTATVIYDAEKLIVGLDKLVKNQKIEVKYHTASAGINEAVAILLLKSN